MQLLLFDIDGTILTTPGTGRRAVEKALTDVFGRSISTTGITFSGKTDPQIIREVLVAADLASDVIDARFDEAIMAYTSVMGDLLNPDDYTVFPGLRPLLDRLADHPRVTLGLLTGNVESMAYLKLRHVGLDSYFPFGAFGSDAPDRNALPPIALDRARARTGYPFNGSETLIIGDTEHDIRCSRVIGAQAVAVCTGHYSREDLAEHEPDHIFDDLEDYESFLEQIIISA